MFVKMMVLKKNFYIAHLALSYANRERSVRQCLSCELDSENFGFARIEREQRRDVVKVLFKRLFFCPNLKEGLSYVFTLFQNILLADAEKSAGYLFCLIVGNGFALDVYPHSRGAFVAYGARNVGVGVGYAYINVDTVKIGSATFFIFKVGERLVSHKVFQ